MSKIYDFFFSENIFIEATGDDALTFLAIAMMIIMFSSLFITHWLTKQKSASKHKAWVPISIKNKPNLNKYN
tara:strand:+ start:235 stop:450 length:216 start_codon:yes stop_codon:yes gene_type:complete